MKFLFILSMLSLGFLSCKHTTVSSTSADSTTVTTTVVFNADSAFITLQAQCAFGPRTPGSDAHQQCGDYIVTKFKALGLDVVEQTDKARMWDGKQYTLRNIIAQYNPTATERIAIATHWDSRPWADADPDSTKHRQAVMAANDGASGVSVMLEIARLLKELNPKVGIDFICFDLEDYGAPYWGKGPDDSSDWCIGSQYWSKTPHRANYTARYGILLDMVGGKNSRFFFEGHSMRYASDIVARIWNTAQTVGAGAYFEQKDGGWITDDHVPMNEVAGIPTVDIIPYSAQGFPPTWHTTHDTPENISKETLKAVGQTLLQVLSEEE